ncbi:hypothetical protein V6N12_019514 [Hibiscus sabdariffa]|uniref:Uncharacterized protein n=1 Tax=Hibiscus sabdariffa TaxID=183260 RepID=A0ABR2BMF8_9ROSI
MGVSISRHSHPKITSRKQRDNNISPDSLVKVCSEAFTIILKKIHLTMGTCELVPLQHDVVILCREQLVRIYQQFMPHIYKVYSRKGSDLKYFTKAFKLSHSNELKG